MATLVRLLSSKQVLVTTCLLAILASSIIVQISGQSTVSVSICIDDLNQGIRLSINDSQYCIALDEMPSNGGTEVQFNGDVYEGGCDDLGDLIGEFTSTVTFGQGSGTEIGVLLIFTVTTPNGILYSESSFTGNFEIGTTPTIGYLQNVIFDYAYVIIDGFIINLNFIGLNPSNGAVVLDMSAGLICLPTFIFAVEYASPISAEATDSAGNVRNGFLPKESVYATGRGLPPDTFFNIYVVYDRAWVDGDSIGGDISSGGINIVKTDASGNLGPVLIWPSPLPIGSYDVVFDRSISGKVGSYDFGDFIDHPNHPGFIVTKLEPGSVAVGGFYLPLNNIVILTPYLVLVSLTFVVFVILFIRKN